MVVELEQENGGFSKLQVETLKALCESFWPSIKKETSNAVLNEYYKRSVKDENFIPEIIRLLSTLPPDKFEDIKRFLYILESRIGCWMLTGTFSNFSSIPMEQRVEIIKTWGTSSLELKRRIHQNFKSIVGMVLCTVLNPEKINLNWEAIGYPGPDPEAKNSIPLNSFEFKMEDHDQLGQELECDAVIVGSGAGGGVVAAQLSQAGYKVIVLEKGQYFKDHEMSQIEREAVDSMYERGASMAAEDSGILIFSGSTFGGGTVVNYSASFRTPDYVLREWSEKHGLNFFTTPEFQKSLDTVCQRYGVRDDLTIHNKQNSVLMRGCENLGIHSGVIPRNVTGSHCCGWCCFGCQKGNKNNSTKTFLKDAALSGNCKFIVSCEAERVIHKNGKALGVIAKLSNGKKIRIKSKIVVSSCGSLHTPALLLRSKINNKNIGKNLHLHPVVTASGVMPEEIKPYEGAIMTWYSDQIGNLDGNHYGVKLEAPSAHLGYITLTLPFESPEVFKERILKTNMSAFGLVIVRDKNTGYVTIDKLGQPLIHYPLGEFERQAMIQGLEQLVKILVASGAKEIITGQEGIPSFKPTSTSIQTPELESFLKEIRKAGIKNFRQAVVSAHQMGSCRMGIKKETSVVNQNGESWDVKGLYCADASTFPTSSGVNPMITTLAISHSISMSILKNMKSKL